MKRKKIGKSMERHPSTSAPFDKWSDEWWASRPREMQARRCTARKSDGTNVRCRNPALRMQNVCRYHGGASKNAQAAAKRRLGEAQDFLARQLLGLAESGESEAVKLAAIKHALSLGGLNEKTALEIEVEMKPYERILAGINFGESRAEARARRGEPPIEDDVIDAELVPDDIDDDEEPPQRPTRLWKPPAADTDRPDDASAAYRATAPAVTGMAAISAAADASRAAGRQSRRRR